MWRKLGVGVALALAACGGNGSPTPSGNFERTRIAALLTAVPTAAPLATSTPVPTAMSSATPLPAPSVTNAPVAQTSALEARTAMPYTYTVTTGDTLSVIARKFGTSIAALQIANDLGESQLVRAGAQLKIPAEKLDPEEGVFWFAYAVRAGDTVNGIVNRFGVSSAVFVRVNRITNPSLLRVGQIVVIPSASPSGAGKAQPAAPRQATAIPVVDQRLILPTEEALLIPLQPRQLPGIENGPVVQSMADGGAATPNPAPDAATGAVEQIRASLLALYNQQRTAAGLAPLEWSPVLQASAQAHAEDCAVRGRCSHTGSDGSTSRMRIQRAGFPGRYTGENWAWSRTAEKAFDMWFFQEAPTGPHRANIMSANYSQVGFGVAPSKGGYFIIANLGG